MSNTAESETQSTETQDTSTNVPLEGNALKEAVLKQVEFYFSEENLSKDAYLISLMDGDYFVPVSTIAQFGKMKALTTDESLIVESLSCSTVVQLSGDNTKIKPREGKRTTLIIHQLPAETTSEEIEEILKKGDFKASVSRDVNNTWFVNLETEEQALDAVLFLRQQKIHNASIRVRLKSETPVKSLYVMDPVPPPVLNVVYGVPGNARGQQGAYWENQQDYGRNYEGKDSYRGRYRKQRKGQNRGTYDGKRRTGRNKKNPGREHKKPAQLQLGPSHFPPLPSAKSEIKPGYPEGFTKYSTEELVATIQALPNDLQRPEGLDNSAFALTNSDNSLEVLKEVDEQEELQEGVAAAPLTETNDNKPVDTNIEQQAEKPNPENQTLEKDNSQKTSSGDANSRTWSQIVTKPESDTEKENSSPKPETTTTQPTKQSNPSESTNQTSSPPKN